jgi:hypothetical protein
MTDTILLNKAIQDGIDRINAILMEAEIHFTKQRIPKEVWTPFPGQKLTYCGLCKIRGEWHLGLRFPCEEGDEVRPYNEMSMVDRVQLVHQLPAIKDAVFKAKDGFIGELKEAITKGQQFLDSFE